MRGHRRIGLAAAAALLGAMVSAPAQAAGTWGPRPDLYCHLINTHEDRTLFLVDPDGYRRKVQTDRTFHLLFTDYFVEERADTNDIPRGPDLNRSTFLARARGSSMIYLITDNSKHRVSVSTMNNCHFAPSNVVEIPEPLFDAHTDGRPWF